MLPVAETPNTPLNESTRLQFFSKFEELRIGLQEIWADIARLSNEQVAKLEAGAVQERLGRIGPQEDIAQDAPLTLRQLSDVERKLRVLASCVEGVKAVQRGSDTGNDQDRWSYQ